MSSNGNGNGKGNEMNIRIEAGILGVLNGEKFFPVKGMATHNNVDIDALGPTLIATFLSIETGAPLMFKNSANGLVEGKTPEQWLNENGIILLDIGNGRFDHHPATKYPGQCATSLFYEIVPADKKSEKLDKFVEFVIDRDTRPTAQPFDFSTMCKVLTANNDSANVKNYLQVAFAAYMNSNSKQPNTALFLQIYEEFAKKKKNIPPTLLNYVKNIKDGKFSNIPDLLTATSENTGHLIRLVMEEVYQNQLDFEQAKVMLKNSPFKTWLNNTRSLVCLKTENKQTLRAALSMGYAVVVIRNESGNTGVYTQINYREINTEDIFRALIEAEASVRKSYDIARKVWYNHIGAKQILNGSFTTPNAISTILTLEEIAGIIVDVCKINNGYLPYCKGGDLQCSDSCKYYWMNVSRCQDVRKEQEKVNEIIGSKNPVIIVSEPGGGKLRVRPEETRRKLVVK